MLVVLAIGSCIPSRNHIIDTSLGWARTSQLMLAGLPSHVYTVTEPWIFGASVIKGKVHTNENKIPAGWADPSSTYSISHLSPLWANKPPLPSSLMFLFWGLGGKRSKRTGLKNTAQWWILKTVRCELLNACICGRMWKHKYSPPCRQDFAVMDMTGPTFPPILRVKSTRPSEILLLFSHSSELQMSSVPSQQRWYKFKKNMQGGGWIFHSIRRY